MKFNSIRIIRFLIWKQNEFWKFFIFQFQNKKLKNERILWNSFFDFKSKIEFENFDFCFLKSVLNQSRFKKIFFCFSFFNSIIKFKKWKMFFVIQLFISNQKINFKILKFAFRFLIWNRSHQSLFLQMGSKRELKLLWNWIKFFKILGSKCFNF